MQCPGKHLAQLESSICISAFNDWNSTQLETYVPIGMSIMPKLKEILCGALSRQTPCTTQIKHISAFNDWNSTKLES